MIKEIFLFQNPDKLRKQKEALLKQKGICIWMYGLSGAGKSTLATFVEEKLTEDGFFVICLDGDTIRKGINSDLGFTEAERFENVRRTAEIASLLVKNGIIVIATLICPLKKMRELACEIIGKEDFIEIFIDASLEECQKRDPKGLYKKAINNPANLMTGLGQTFEKPDADVIRINTDILNEAEAKQTTYQLICNLLIKKAKE